MRQARWTWISLFSVLSVGCIAHMDSSAESNSEADGGSDAETAPQKPGQNNDDDSGTPAAVAGRGASKPMPTEDDDDAGRPVVAMPKAGSMSTPRPDAGTPPPDAGTAPPPDAGMACDFRGLVQMKCAGSACHGAPASGTGLDLTSPMLAMRVEGRKGPSACSNTLLIDKANPKRSALYLKVTGTECGSRMPLGGQLTPSEQACVLSWIDGL